LNDVNLIATLGDIESLYDEVAGSIKAPPSPTRSSLGNVFSGKSEIIASDIKELEKIDDGDANSIVDFEGESESKTSGDARKSSITTSDSSKKISDERKSSIATSDSSKKISGERKTSTTTSESSKKLSDGRKSSIATSDSSKKISDERKSSIATSDSSKKISDGRKSSTTTSESSKIIDERKSSITASEYSKQISIASKSIDRTKPEQAYVPGPCFPKNPEWGILFLNAIDVSGIEIARTLISCESPVSTEATARILFETVFKEKARALIGGALSEWNVNVTGAEAGRRMTEKRQVETKVRELVIWFKDVREKAMEVDEEFDPSTEFKRDDVLVEKSDSWEMDNELYLLRIVPCVLEDGTVTWQYRQVNSLLYDKHAGAYNSLLTRKKRKTARPVSQAVLSRGVVPDSLVGAYITSNDEGGDEKEETELSSDEEEGSGSEDERPLVKDPKLKNLAHDDSSVFPSIDLFLGR
jgi:hypothetical protein